MKFPAVDIWKAYLKFTISIIFTKLFLVAVLSLWLLHILLSKVEFFAVDFKVFGKTQRQIQKYFMVLEYDTGVYGESSVGG